MATKTRSRSRTCARTKTRKVRKSVVRIPISRSNELGRFGYKDIAHKSMTQRRKALKKYLNHCAKTKKAKRVKVRKIIQKLNALSILQKNTNPTVSKRVRSDQKFMSRVLHNLQD